MLSHLGRAHLLAYDLDAARRHLREALSIAETRAWAGVTAAPLALLGHAADAIHRSRPERGGHLWSHVWALTDASTLASLFADARAATWHDEALATTLRCGMRGLAARLASDEPVRRSAHTGC
jgi:hypothetical protein